MNDFILTIIAEFSVKNYIFDILWNFPAKNFFWSDLVDSRGRVIQQFNKNFVLKILMKWRIFWNEN